MAGMVVGEQAGKADHPGLMLTGGGNEFFRRMLVPRSTTAKWLPLPHHGDEIFADVVEVSLHGADDGGEFGCDSRLNEGRARGSRVLPSWPGAR